MASSSPTHPNYSPLFIKPPSPVNEPELAELWAQMDKYIMNGYQDTSSDEEEDYDAKWGERMTGNGPYAEMIRMRFEAACARLGLNEQKLALTTEHFAPPRRGGEQLSLF